MSFLTTVTPRFLGFRRVAELLFFSDWGRTPVIETGRACFPVWNRPA